MKFKLSQILESNILLEGRKEDVIKKYGEEHTELIQLLSGMELVVSGVSLVLLVLIIQIIILMIIVGIQTFIF